LRTKNKKGKERLQKGKRGAGRKQNGGEKKALGHQIKGAGRLRRRGEKKKRTFESGSLYELLA